MKFFIWKKKDQRLNLNLSKIKDNHKKIKETYNVTLKILTNVLNKYHNLKEDRIFWETIIGHWLLSFVHVAHCEYLKKFSKKENNLILEPSSSYSQFNSFLINEKFRFNLFKAINSKKNVIKIINNNQVKSNFNFYSLCYLSLNLFASFFFKKKISMKIEKISYKTDYRINYLLKIASFEKEFLDHKTRVSINKMISENKNKKKFITSTLNIIHWYIPINYLENFRNINNYFKKKSFVCENFFTTHSHVVDDIFKIFLANWKSNNKKNRLNIIQHGGGYQIYRFNTHGVLEGRLADNFLGWGTYSKLYEEKYIPFFINKEFEYLKLDSPRKQNKILLIAKDLMRFDFGTTDVHPHNYIKIYKKLMDWLEKDKSNQFDLRLYGTQKMLLSKTNHLNFYYTILKNVIKKKYLKTGDKPIKETLTDYNLVLHTYFGTAFYETLSINFPTIIYLDKTINKIYTSHFLKSVKFAENKIIFYNEKKLKSFIKSKSFNNWYSKKNQIIVKKLQNKLCRLTDKKSYLLLIKKIAEGK